MFKFKLFFTASALLIGIFVILSSVFFVNVSDYIINFVENNLSNDNNLSLAFFKLVVALPKAYHLASPNGCSPLYLKLK